MTVGIGLAAVVAFLVIAELGRVLVARLFGYQPERHAIPIMKLPGSRGTTGFRLTLILAGPVAVYLAVAALAFGLYACHGQVSAAPATRIGHVLADSAAAGKIAPGDVLVEVDGQRFPGGASWLAEQVTAKGGAEVVLTVDRGGAKHSFPVTPTQRDGRWRLGVMFESDRTHDLGAALRDGFLYPARNVAAVFQGMIEVFTGDEEADVGGPVRIAAEFRNAFNTSTSLLIFQLGMIFGTYTLIGLALFDLVRALLLILFRS